MSNDPRTPPERRGASPHNATRRAEPKAAGPGATAGAEKGGLETFIDLHKRIAKDSLQRLLRTPLSSLLTWAVIAIALALPVSLFVLLSNLQTLSENWSAAPRISLFLNVHNGTAQAHQLEQMLEKKQGVADVRYISPEAGLASFREKSGLGDILDYLDTNPLPPVLVVTPSHQVDSAAAMESLFNDIKNLPGVERAQLDLHWVKRLYSLIEFARRAILALAAMLAVAVLLVIGNTIRLAIENRRDEIVVVKLVGGTDGFVRRPFLYTGIWYGLGGGILAWFLVLAWLLWLSGPVDELAQLYGLQFRLAGLGFESTIYLLLTSMALGWVGAWIAVRRHLDAIEP